MHSSTHAPAECDSQRSECPLEVKLQSLSLVFPACVFTVTNALVSTTSSSSSSYLQQYTFQNVEPSNAPVTEVQSSSTPIIMGSDGSYYALVPTADGQHQLIKLVDIGTDERDMGDLPDIVGGVSRKPPAKSLTTAAVDMSNGE